MPKFKLLLTRMVSEYAEVYVEAASREAAEELTIDDVDTDDADWQVGQGQSDLEVSDVEEVG